MRIGIGLRLSHEEGALLFGPALQLQIDRAVGEMFFEDGDGREHFRLELRYPLNERVELLGGTRADRWDSSAPEDEALIAGLRFHLADQIVQPYLAARVFQGSRNYSGFGAETGALFNLPRSLEMIASAEWDTLERGPETMETTRASVRLRYVIQR